MVLWGVLASLQTFHVNHFMISHINTSAADLLCICMHACMHIVSWTRPLPSPALSCIPSTGQGFCDTVEYHWRRQYTPQCVCHYLVQYLVVSTALIFTTDTFTLIMTTMLWSVCTEDCRKIIITLAEISLVISTFRPVPWKPCHSAHAGDAIAGGGSDLVQTSIHMLCFIRAV